MGRIRARQTDEEEGVPTVMPERRRGNAALRVWLSRLVLFRLGGEGADPEAVNRTGKLAQFAPPKPPHRARRIQSQPSQRPLHRDRADAGAVHELRHDLS